MKRFVWLFILVLTVVLVGCNSEDGQEVNEEEENKEEVVENDEQIDEENSGELISEENEVEIENEEPIEEEEVKEPLYEIVGISDFAPIEDANPNVVLITIDDAPDGNALEMATTLKEMDVPAIFFVNGIFINNEEKREIVKEIYDMGFAIGNHTYSHQNLQKVSEDQQKEEIISLNELIEEITGEKPKFFRAPHGANTDFVKQFIEDEGMLLMNWTYGYDYFQPYMDAEKLVTAMVTGEGPEVDVNYSLLKPGANLLMHDRTWTNEALPGIIKGLREKGYDFIDPDTILIPKNEE